MRDSRFKVRAFFEEFPFLSEVAEKEKVEEIVVRRIDENFLQRKPRYEGATGSLVGLSDNERIFLFTTNGEIIEVEQEESIHHNEAHWDNEYRPGETVGEALLKLNDPNDVVYAARVHTGYIVESHHSVGGYSVTLYKPPKGFGIQQWVEEQKARAMEDIQAQIAEIDGEG